MCTNHDAQTLSCGEVSCCPLSCPQGRPQVRHQKVLRSPPRASGPRAAYLREAAPMSKRRAAIRSRRAHGAVGYPVVPNLTKTYLPPMTRTGPDLLYSTTRIEPLTVITLAVVEVVLAPSRPTRGSPAVSPSKTVPTGQFASAPRRAMFSHRTPGARELRCSRPCPPWQASRIGIDLPPSVPIDRSSATLFPGARRAHANSAASSNVRCRVKSYGRRGL
jgi:hypothetical protein